MHRLQLNSGVRSYGYSVDVESEIALDLILRIEERPLYRTGPYWRACLLRRARCLWCTVLCLWSLEVRCLKALGANRGGIARMLYRLLLHLLQRYGVLLWCTAEGLLATVHGWSIAWYTLSRQLALRHKRRLTLLNIGQRHIVDLVRRLLRTLRDCLRRMLRWRS